MCRTMSFYQKKNVCFYSNETIIKRHNYCCEFFWPRIPIVQQITNILYLCGKDDVEIVNNI